MSPHPVETTVFRFRARDADGSARSPTSPISPRSRSSIRWSCRISRPGISAELAARTKAAYLEKAELKKADVGGGMIHGSAEDFAGDASGRILLSHGIASIPGGMGKNASIALFGDEDVLIATGKRRAIAAAPVSAERLRASRAMDDIEEITAYLRWNAPFADLSTPALAEIAVAARFERLREGRSLASGGQAAIWMILAGRARITAGSRTVGALGPGDFFGEEGLIVEGRCLFDAVALESVEAYRIPYEAVEDRPILLWRLREKLETRLSAVKSVFDFSWRPAFSVGEPELDDQHRRLFSLIGKIDEAAWSPESCPDAPALVVELADFARLHFETEEAFMRRGGYPELAAHSREHESLLRDVAAFSERIDCGDEEALERPRRLPQGLGAEAHPSHRQAVHAVLARGACLQHLPRL